MSNIAEGVHWAPGMERGGRYAYIFPDGDRFMVVECVVLEIQEEAQTCTVSILEAVYIDKDELPDNLQSVADLRKQHLN